MLCGVFCLGNSGQVSGTYKSFFHIHQFWGPLEDRNRGFSYWVYGNNKGVESDVRLMCLIDVVFEQGYLLTNK